MGPFLTAYIFTMGSLFLGAVACTFAFGAKVVMKITTIWAMLLTIAFFTNIVVLTAAIVFYAMSIKQESAETKIIYFVALMPALPLYGYIVPFPGLNYLWDLSYLRIVVLALFLPLFIQFVSGPKTEATRLRSSDVYFLGFIILVSIMTIRTGNVISTGRSLFSNMVDFGIPYFVISRYLVTAQALHWVLCGFLISAAYMSFFSIIETLRTWRFFSELLFALNLPHDPVALVPYSRDGMVRAAGGPMFQTLAFAYFVALAIVVSFYFWQQRILRFFPAMILMGLYSVALMFTDSKGGMLAVLTGVFILYYMKLNKSIRFIVNIVCMVVIPGVMGYLISTGFSTVDSEGSFAYRYQLVLNSFNAISQNPILGSANFINNATLERSIQGEGIIDVVNLYLQVVLEYGFVGLFLYVMTFLSLIKGVMKKSAVAVFDHKAIIIALLVMTMVFIVTCSGVSFIPRYIMLLWAVSRAYIVFQEVHANHGMGANHLAGVNKTAS